MKPPQIEIHIEQMRLAAMPQGGEDRLREVLQRELAKLASASYGNTLPWHNYGIREHCLRNVSTGRPERRTGAQSTGEQIAHNLHAGIARKVKP